FIWIAFGIASLVATVLCWKTFGPDHRAVAAGGGTTLAEPRRGWGRAAWTLIIAYGLYGFGYIIPGTFLPVIARDLLGGAFASGWFWPMFGAAAFAGTLLVGHVSDTQMRASLVACFFVESLGVIFPVAVENAAGLAIGSVLL